MALQLCHSQAMSLDLIRPLYYFPCHLVQWHKKIYVILLHISNGNSQEGTISQQCYLVSSRVPRVEVSLCSLCWVPDPNTVCASDQKKKSPFSMVWIKRWPWEHSLSRRSHWKANPSLLSRVPTRKWRDKDCQARGNETILQSLPWHCSSGNSLSNSG